MGGGRLLILYSSLFKLVSTFHPEFDWLPWKFNTCPRNFWDDLQNQRKFMEWAGKELKINEMKDWYNVSNQVKNKEKKQCLYL